jgi:hypothetical protein
MVQTFPKLSIYLSFFKNLDLEVLLVLTKIKEPPKTLLTTISLREELAMIKPLETRN